MLIDLMTFMQKISTHKKRVNFCLNPIYVHLSVWSPAKDLSFGTSPKLQESTTIAPMSLGLFFLKERLEMVSSVGSHSTVIF